MTISNTAIRKAGPSQGNGVNTAFPFAFKVFNSSDVLVTYLNGLGIESALRLGTDYTVTLNPDQNAAPGGVVNTIWIPAADTSITLTSQLSNTQNLSLTNSGGFYPQSINDALDRIVIQIQQVAEKLSRTITLNQSTTSALNIVLSTANTVLGFNASGVLTNLPAQTGTSLVNLASSIGSALIGTIQSFTGAVLRTVAAKLNDTASVKDFGAIGNGIADDTAAIQAALTYAVANNVPIFFPYGKYKITGNITVNFPSSTSVLIIKGAGSSASKIISPSGCGIIINFIGMYNSIQVSGLTVLGGLTNTGTAFLITQTGTVGNPCDCATSLFYDVTIAGTSTNTFFQTSISITGASCFNFKSVSIYGNTTSGFVGLNCGYGIIFQGNGAGQPIPVQFNIESCTLNNLTVGMYYGNYVQGVAVSLTNFTQCNWGILEPTTAAQTDQLTVMGCQFNCASRGILLQNILVNTMISNNLFLIPDGVIGLDVIYATCLTITGNTFNYESTGVSTTGIAIESTFNGSITPSKSTAIITANTFLGLGVGVWLWAGCVGVKCFGNLFGQMLTADIVDAGTRSILGKPVGLTAVNLGTNTTVSASVSFTPVTSGTLKITGVVNYQDLGTTNYNSTLTVAGSVVQQLASKQSTSHTWCVAVIAGTAITSTITGQSAGALTVEISMLFVPDI